MVEFLEKEKKHFPSIFHLCLLKTNFFKKMHFFLLHLIIHPVICSVIHLVICPVINPVIHLVIHPVIHQVIHQVIHPVICMVIWCFPIWLSLVSLRYPMAIFSANLFGLLLYHFAGRKAIYRIPLSIFDLCLTFIQCKLIQKIVTYKSVILR